MNDWNDVENKIDNTIKFIKSHIILSPYSSNDPIRCNECLFRDISILVLSGKIILNTINDSNNLIWGVTKSINNDDLNKKHGADWHNDKINSIKKYFQTNNYQTEIEPLLFFGRADLGIPKIKIFIEVGTVNLYKLYYNLLNMHNCRLLIVPSNNSIIEFIL